MRGGGREIGRIGTVARMIGGVILIAVPIAGHGISWWDAGAAMIALPSIAFAIAAVLRIGQPRSAALTATGVRAVLVIAIVIAIGTALTVITPIDQVAIWTFLGASMLLAALRGHAGCELLAIPNALTGRRDRLDCLIYTPIDRAEAMRAGSGPRRAP